MKNKEIKKQSGGLTVEIQFDERIYKNSHTLWNCKKIVLPDTKLHSLFTELLIL